MALRDAVAPEPACSRAEARDGATIYFERFIPPDRPEGSAGDARTILLVMGLGMNGRAWSGMARRLLDAGYDVLALDNRGCGHSTAGMRPWTTSTMAEDAVAVLDEAGIERAHILGASLGGMIAQELALRNPERVRTLMLACTTGGLPRVDLLPRAGFVELLETVVKSRLPGADDEDAIRAFVRLGCSPEFAESCQPGTEGWEVVRRMLEEPMPALGFGQQIMAAARHSTWSRLDRLTMPVLIQHGTGDKIMPVAAARELARRVRTAELKVYAGVGHAIALERPDEAVEVIMSFIERNDPEARREPEREPAAAIGA
jgi:pimeloyl-ACP methyl ester carboxylesterase